MPKKSNTYRDLMPGHGAGKGDADRSPGWRDGYDDINWTHNVAGFEQAGPGRQRKRYAPSVTAVSPTPED